MITAPYLSQLRIRPGKAPRPIANKPKPTVKSILTNLAKRKSGYISLPYKPNTAAYRTICAANSSYKLGLAIYRSHSTRGGPRLIIAPK